MIVSSITQTKAEAQKLIKLYNKLQAEAKTADTEEAARKVAEAEKLVSQINTLQSAIAKIKTRDKEVNLKKNATPAANKKANTTIIEEDDDDNEELKRAEREKIELEKRINRIEETQKYTRAQIEQLNRAKAELSRLQNEAEKNAVNVVALERNAYNDTKMSQKLAKLTGQLTSRDTEYQKLKKELDTVRKQAQKDAEILKKERDTALEKQKLLEKEKMAMLRRNGNSELLKGFSIGIGISVLSYVLLYMVRHYY